jgi:hypothetical protein
VVALLGLISLSSARVWDGIWQQEEYSVTFRDREGKPVPDVRLSVENESGDTFYHFPVADYLPGHVPASDADGVLVFHHVPASWVGGRDWWLAGLIHMGEHEGPAYVCRFLHHGREVHRIRYGDLVNRGVGVVRRRWKWLTWAELQDQVFGGLEWDYTDADRVRVFDRNDNGRLEREERYAAGAARRAQETAIDLMTGRRPEWEEYEFRLVERAVVVVLP